MKRSVFITLTILLAGLAACQSTSPLLVSGKVTDSDGIPLNAGFAALLSTDDYSIASGPSAIDRTGHYQLAEVPGGHDYILLIIPFSGRTKTGYILHGHTPALVFLKNNTGSLFHNLILVPCHDYIFEIYRADGSLILNDDWIGVRFAGDMTGNAVGDIFIGIDKGDESTSVPNTCVPVGRTRRFFFQSEIPGFGNVVLSADNDGKGYTASGQGGTLLNLNYELARTQINRLRSNLHTYHTAGYDIPATVAMELTAAETILDEAASLTGVDMAASSDRAASTVLWALENLELARAEQDIPRYRMGNLTVTVLDAAGRSLPNASITYTQISHDFLFGIFDTLENAGVDGYDLMKEAGINYFTTGFYWNETEPEQNKITWDKIDHTIGVLDLAGMDFTMKGHALLALWDFATPNYLKDISFDEFNREVYDHISTLAGHYRNEIDIWNVINEAHGRGAALTFSRSEITTLTQTGIQAIRENDPDARIIINNSFDWYGESRVMETLLKDTVDKFTISVPAYLDQLAADSIDYDIIGQQLYNSGYVSIFSDWGLGDPSGVPAWDLDHHSKILDRLGKYGKPVHITEQSVPSTWQPEWKHAGTGWWHHPWNEETQAEFLHNFYTIAFSKKKVEAVTWWNINDNGSFIASGGLLDSDNRPKQAYFTLRDLITRWTSSGKIMTDTAGKAAIRGYGGEYELTVAHGNHSWQGKVSIREQQDKKFTVQLSNAGD